MFCCLYLRKQLLFQIKLCSAPRPVWSKCSLTVADSVMLLFPEHSSERGKLHFLSLVTADLKRPRSILADPSRPVFNDFTSLPSGCRCSLAKCRTNIPSFLLPLAFYTTLCDVSVFFKLPWLFSCCPGCVFAGCTENCPPRDDKVT